MIRNFRLATVLSLLVLLPMLSAHAADQELDKKITGYSSYRWNGGIIRPFSHSEVRMDQSEEEYTAGIQAPRAPAVVGIVRPSPEASASPGKTDREVPLPAVSKAIPVTSREVLRNKVVQLAMQVKGMEIDAKSDSVRLAGMDALTLARLDAAADKLHTELIHYVIMTQEQIAEKEGNGELSAAERARLSRQRRALDGLLTKASELHLRSTMLGASNHPKYQVETLEAVKVTLSQMVEMMKE